MAPAAGTAVASFAFGCSEQGDMPRPHGRIADLTELHAWTFHRDEKNGSQLRHQAGIPRDSAVRN